jgi:hypothetical protein
VASCPADSFKTCGNALCRHHDREVHLEAAGGPKVRAGAAQTECAFAAACTEGRFDGSLLLIEGSLDSVKERTSKGLHLGLQYTRSAD